MVMYQGRLNEEENFLPKKWLRLTG